MQTYAETNLPIIMNRNSRIYLRVGHGSHFFQTQSNRIHQYLVLNRTRKLYVPLITVCQCWLLIVIKSGWWNVHKWQFERNSIDCAAMITSFKKRGHSHPAQSKPLQSMDGSNPCPLSNSDLSVIARAIDVDFRCLLWRVSAFFVLVAVVCRPNFDRFEKVVFKMSVVITFFCVHVLSSFADFFPRISIGWSNKKPLLNYK